MSFKDLVTIVGTIVGILVGIVTLIEKLRKYVSSESRTKIWHWFAGFLPTLSGILIRYQLNSTFLLREIAVVTGFGLTLNYIGLAVSTHLKSLIYLDMVGTALTAYLLGPFWGAIVGLLSNSAVNWIFVSDVDGHLIFPWSLVNIAGGLYWGTLARHRWFRQYVQTKDPKLSQHLRFLFVWGVLGAIVMGFIGTGVQASLGRHTILAFDEKVAGSIASFVASIAQFLGVAAGPSAEPIQNIAWYCLNWVQNSIRYVPDKCLSASLGLVVMRCALPLYNETLNCGANKPRDITFGSILLFVLYLPSAYLLLFRDAFSGRRHWLLWISPVVVSMFGLLWSVATRDGGDDRQRLKVARTNRYAASRLRVADRSRHIFFDMLLMATIWVSVVFALIMLCIGVPVKEFFSVSFRFFGAVYGSCGCVLLMRESLLQSIAVFVETSAERKSFPVLVVDLDVPSDLQGLLSSHGIQRITQLVEMTEGELVATVKGIGAKKGAIIREALSRHGLSFRID